MTQFITRAYNSFEIDKSNLSVVIKKSEEKRLLDEINYYKNLPLILQPFFPRMFSSSESDGDYRMSLEYYAYQNVGNKMIHSDFDATFWKSFFNVISKYFDSYTKHTAEEENKQDCYHMFISKTEKEYQNLVNNFEFFGELQNFDHIYLNGYKLQNFNMIWPKIKNYVEENLLDSKLYLIHGDFCFSNILFGQNDITKDVILKFIDPRGSFGKSLNGDLYYDLAKLSHSCNGGYEYFITDNFEIKNNSNDFRLNFINDNKEKVDNYFLNFATQNNYDIKKIRTLEGTIFIGMCARHYDSFERQKAMYLTGLKILNEIYETL